MRGLLRNHGLEVAVVVVSMLAYCQTLAFPFLSFDDPAYVTLQDYWREPTLPALWTALSGECLGTYAPVQQLSYFLDRLLFGPSAWGPRLTNVLLHGACTVFLLRGLRRFGLPRAGALVGGLLFALHPSHVEIVSWVSARKDLLAGLGCLVALDLYLGAEEARPLSWGRGGALLLALNLGLGAKIFAAAGVAWIALLALWRGRLRLDAPLILLAGLSACVWIGLNYASHSSAVEVEPRSLGEQARLVARAGGFYLQRGPLPWPINPFPGWPSATWQLADLTSLAALALAAGCALRWRPAALLLAAYLAALAPVLHLLGFHHFAHLRYLFLPTIPLALLAGWAFGAAGGPRSPRIRLIAAGIALACGWVTLGYVPHWRDRLSLSRLAVRAAPEALEARLELVYALAIAGPAHAGEALATLDELERIHGVLPEILSARAGLLAKQGRLDEALASFWRLDVARFDPRGRANRAYLELWTGHLDRAAETLSSCSGDAPDLRCMRAIVLLERGQAQQAKPLLRAALPEFHTGGTLRTSGTNHQWRQTCLLKLAECERALGDRSAAAGALRELSPGAAQLALLAHLALDTGDRAGAARALRLAPRGSLSCDVARVRFAQLSGDDAAARRMARELVRRGGSRARHLLTREGLSTLTD